MPDPAVAPQTESALPGTPAAWSRVQDLVCELTVELLMPGLRVRDVVRLEKGTVIDSHWQVGTDVPLRVNGELLSWSEFEVVATRLAVRVTELA